MLRQSIIGKPNLRHLFCVKHGPMDPVLLDGKNHHAHNAAFCRASCSISGSCRQIGTFLSIFIGLVIHVQLELLTIQYRLPTLVNTWVSPRQFLLTLYPAVGNDVRKSSQYEDRLRWLDLHSLNRRRLRGERKAAYKVFCEELETLLPPPFYSKSPARIERSPIQSCAESLEAPLQKKFPLEYKSSRLGTSSPLLPFPPLASTYSNANCDLPPSNL